MKLSQEDYERLRDLSLEEVMGKNNYKPAYRNGVHLMYVCPFHKDSDPSLSVDISPTSQPDGENDKCCWFHCYGCKKSGYGAIQLQAALLGVPAKGEGYTRAVHELAHLFGLKIDGVDYAEWFHRQHVSESVSDEIVYTYKEEFTDDDLRALGCQVNANGSTSWGDIDRGRTLQETFSVYPVEKYLTEARHSEKYGRTVSYEISSTPAQPVFAFVFRDAKGWWSKRYEPMARPTANGPAYRFTWWYEKGVKREEELRNMLYGDADVMRALSTGEVRSSDERRGTCSVSVRKDNGDKETVTKFRRLVICSGPRDAMSVYFHSDVHVVYPHSETVGISQANMRSLRRIAAQVYVLYDADRTGRLAAERLCLQNIDVRLVRLPSDLSSITSSRTGKPCKDAEEYFTYYPPMLKQHDDFRHSTIDYHFSTLLANNNAKTMKFWVEKYTSRKDEFGEQQVFVKYTINIDNMAQFLSARGLKRYQDPTGVMRFVLVRDNIVDFIPDAEIHTLAKQLMKEFLANHPQWGNEDLSNAISDTRRLRRDTLEEIPVVELDFRAWGPDFDYLYFRNGAVYVTADEAKLVPYSQFPYAVNRSAILDEDFHPLDKPLMSITQHPLLEERRTAMRMRLKNAASDQLAGIRSEFRAWEKLYKWTPEFESEDWNDLPDFMRFLLNTGNPFWRKQDVGMALRPEDRQFILAHFVSKVNALGYMLHRYRTDTRQMMVTATDYSVIDEGKSSGRSGKTMMKLLLSSVRKGYIMEGKKFKVSAENMGRNFDQFRYMEQYFGFIDDLKLDIDAERFYNMTTSITIKSLYNNEVTLPQQDAIKLMITMNKGFDWTVASTYGRMLPMLFSDYYHEESVTGSDERRTPETEFGREIICRTDDPERTLIQNFMVECLQFWLRHNDRIIPPMEKEGNMRILYAAIKEQDFITFCNDFFSNPHHLERPISVTDMVIGYLTVSAAPCTREEVSRRTYKFKQMLRVYCENMGITINPDVVYRGQTDKNEGVVRCMSWGYTWIGDKLTPQRAREKAMHRCMYFYRYGNEPRSAEQVLPCEERDPDAEDVTDNNE